MGITPGAVTSDWLRLCKGIIKGCTISVTLFSLKMSMGVKATEMEHRGALNKCSTATIRAYMDDLTIAIAYILGSRWILEGLGKSHIIGKNDF